MNYLIIGLLLLVVYVLFCLKNYAKPLDHPNQAPFLWYPWPVVGNLVQIFWNDYHHKALELDLRGHAERDAHSWRVVGIKGVSICDPPSVQHILNDNFKNYVKGDYMITILKPLLGEGIFAINGEKWKNQRLHSKSFFRRQEIEEMIPTFAETGNRVLSILQDHSLKDQQYIDAQDLFYRFTFDSILKIGFGIDTINCLDNDLLSNQLSEAFNYLQAEIDRRGDNPLLRFYSFLKFNRVLNQFDTFAYQIIAKRKAELLQDPSSLSTKNLLTKFLNSIPPDEASLPQTDTYLRDILINFFLAGRDTTATLLSWTLYLLITHPIVEQKVMSEIHEHFGDKDDFDFTCTNLDQMKYLGMVLDEVLRLYPPVPVNFKRALEDDILPNGCFISKGTEVQYNTWTLHRLKRLWGEDAEEFRPERWETDVKNVVGKGSGMHRFQYIPFHAGPRTCLGMQMALVEAKVLLVMVLRCFRFTLKPGLKVEPKKVITLQMENGLFVQVHPRAEV